MSMNVASMITKGVGSVTGISGILAQGKAQQKAAEFNALMADKRGQQEESLIRKRGEQVKGRARALIGKSGVRLEGSPLEALAESAAATEIDALNARFTARTQASLQRGIGRQARKQAGMSAFGKFLSDSANIASQAFGGGGS